MDTEDETNSYLKFLNDTETPNTFLLETSEVGMFSEEPIFTEINTADWPSEGFPLLLTNPLITEEQLIDVNEGNVTEHDDQHKDDEKNHSKCDNQKSSPEESAERTNKEARVVQLLDNDGNSLLLDKSVLKGSKNQQHTTNISDLFYAVRANKCRVCSHLCESLEQIKVHISEKHPGYLTGNGVSILIKTNQKSKMEENNLKKEYTVYVCSVCHDVCTSKNDLRQHMIETHNLMVEPSKNEQAIDPEENECKTIIYRKSSMLSDLTVNVIKKQERAHQKIKCNIVGCTAGFPTEEIRKKHESLHDTKYKSYFNCSHCDVKFKMWRIARNHMYKEHGLDFGMINCPMCNTFKSYHAVPILKHMVIHSKEKPFLCSVCGKSFKQWSQLKNHEVIHRAPEELPSWSKVKKCDMCQRFFANSKCLKVHVQAVHEKFKPFICNICGHKTTRKAMLELHLRQHTGAKPHKCSYCPYKTGDYNCLRKHVMKHVGAFQYKCPHCAYTCIQSGSLKSHLNNKHKGKEGTFSCKYCPYTTINPNFLEAHLKKHVESECVVVDRNGEQNKVFELQTDKDSQNCFPHTDHAEGTVDNGGITIPADLEVSLS
ncbi:hypothetical protein GWI33_013695 [Rhynchophorus ferrugineus]|uniref:C2H2-type domain-containing protein n=1 Tax=Rhynchophorus ferrugineus TaxID=354439 RepID=A0A834I2V6_RHYFE|nr:hypothetical protein GWI33_013695 [Rhynchophorus ferrugineus]